VTSRAPVEIGSDFLGYRIEELIGRGGMGVVYRAFDLRLNRIVALKLVTPELARDERFRRRFTRETELAMALEHPNVVPIHDAGDVDGRLYLAMRLVDGTDLRALLRADGPLDHARALAICRQVANALDAAHAKGLVHRDVKPSNVLLDPNEHVYLADFGLTRRLGEQGAQPGDGRSLGTPAYLAPEQIEGGSVDGRTDVYSLGCLLFECLTGRAPFLRDSRLAVAWAHLEEEPPAASAANPQLPVALDAVLCKAMAKDPDDRNRTCAELVASAEQALGVRRHSVLGRRWAILSAALVLVVAAALAAVLATRGGVAARRPAPVVVHANTVVRLDPRTNAITRVVDVGNNPMAAAAAGHSVWTYNADDGSVTEVDARSNESHTTMLHARPIDLGLFTGPVLAADAGGAWVVGVHSSHGVLTRVRSAGAGSRSFPLPIKPKAVAVGAGAVWVLGKGRRAAQLLRVDPATGAVEARVLFPRSSKVSTVAVGYGAVYVLATSTATLYRIDPRSATVIRRADYAGRAGRILFVYRQLWIPISDYAGGRMILADPRTLKVVDATSCCSLRQDADAAAGYESQWTNQTPSGTTVRWDAITHELAHVFRVTDPPLYNGDCLTSIAAGAGAVWVTVAAARPADAAAATNWACPGRPQ
jgi:hypothetical protein